MDSTLLKHAIPETELDGNHIQSRMLHFLKNLVDQEGKVAILPGEEINHDFYFYRKQAMQLIQNNKTTLRIDFNHLTYADPEFSEVVYYYYYKVE